MNQTLSRFLEALRHAELRISPAEALDAYRTVAAVGPGDRTLLKDALAVSLAKSPEDKARLDETFERFFGAAVTGSPGLEERLDRGALGDLGELGDAGPVAAQLLEGDGAGLAAALQQAAQSVGLERMWLFTQKNLFARRMVEAMGLADLERAIAAGEGPGSARTEALEGLRSEFFTLARQHVEREFDLFARDTAKRLVDERLAQTRLYALDRRDQERMKHLVRRMAKRLASLYAVRHRRPRRGALDVRRTMRRNHPNDDMLFSLHWRTKRVERPRVVVICDVSRSVAALAQFLLLFVHCLSEVLRDIRSYVLCSDLVETTELFENYDLEGAIERSLSAVMLGATDYGQALEDFTSLGLPHVNRRTTVLILGDARSNNTNPRVELMQRLHDQARFVMWLNPEPESFWGTGDSEMLRYRPHVDFAKTVSSLKDLDRTISILLSRAVR